MRIYTETLEGVTVIQNSFIDQYMPHANGEFVKVYLYLLRCANTKRELSLSSIADVFEHTEKDIQRALTYWEKQKLLRMKLSSDGTVVSVTFSDPLVSSSTDDTADEQNIREPGPPKEQGYTVSGTSAARTPSTVPSRERIAAVCQQQEIRQLFFVAEQYLQHPLTSSEQQELVYYYDTLQFSVDLIEYLLEYCISKGSGSIHYMRKVALSWAEAGISTVLQAKQESNLYNKNYFTVMNAFGIKGRNPAPAEQDIMARWFGEWGFSVDLVLEACKRTIQKTHEPSFSYANRILKDWHKSKVSSLEDVRRLDLQHQESKKKAEQSKASDQPARSSGNRFNNFSQREYDYSQLEKQLLNQ